MSTLEQLTRIAEIGEQARRFMESDLGVALLAKADAQVHEAVCRFAEADAGDLAKIRQLQLDVRMGLAFGEWLTQLMDSGNEAMSIYMQQKES